MEEGIKVNSEYDDYPHSCGYHVTYSSGWVLSVQWGRKGIYAGKNTVEVMAWRKGKDMTETQLWEDGVVGWVTVERLAKLQYLLAKGTPYSINQARTMKW